MKAHLLTGMIAIMSIGGLAGCSNSGKPLNSPETEKDARIIVEVDRPLEGLSENEILASQSKLLKKIAHNVTSNFTQVDSYTVLNNAFSLDVNSKDIEAIRNLNGVKSVTVDKAHAYKAIGSGATYQAGKYNLADPNENISAVTMHKPGSEGTPGSTNDGEGTVVAILDNEFFFRGTHDVATKKDECSFWKFGDAAHATTTEDVEIDGVHHNVPVGCTGHEIHHEVFDDLDASIAKRFTFDNLKSVTTSTHAKRKSSTVAAGTEGSLYFNSKVPFYYDYGGESTSYGKAGPMDYDVSSAITFHGSHVASITAANAPSYKGIAPKAQLACMKVFTNFKADETSKNLGFSDSSGAYDSCILAALEDCIKLGVDGINMSLGSDLDDFDSDSITLKTLTKLANSGILSAISAGNSGKTSYSFAGSYGNWTTDMVETGIMSSYANNAAVTTCASGQPIEIYYKTAIAFDTNIIAYEDQIVNREGLDDDYSTEIKLESILPSAKKFVYVQGFGQDADYDAGNPELYEGSVVIVNRGSTSFADKYATAVAHDAAGLIIINNDPTATDFNFRCSFGDGFNPTIPCALVLYKDKGAFTPFSSTTKAFDFVNDEVADNPLKYTLSTFTTDGATYNYDLKPEITAPGDIIRGAVPPQTKKERLNPLSSYEYLSGTSMSAPNLAGAQSVMVSKVAKDIYAGLTPGSSPTTAQLDQIKAYRKTVDMRLQSTADPMDESSVNPETEELNYASPRLQGAGMVDLDGAYNTDVYLEGLDEQGNKLNKSKIVLRNSEDISKGDVKLSFIAHNESTSDRHYKARVTIMRPAIKSANLVATREYNFRNEISDIKYLPGVSFFNEYSETQQNSYGEASYHDVFRLSRDIEFYKNEYDFDDGIKTTMKAGMWYVASEGVDQNRNVVYQELPGYDYQSTQDVVLAEISGQDITVNAAEAGKTTSQTITIDTYSLTAQQKADIAKYYPYGCAIEGFVELESQDSLPDLNIPFLGFYAGDLSYKDAPVVEPFDFEKKDDVIYPSYLVNDIAKTLVGRDNADMGSNIVIGYSENPENLNTDKILTNDLNLSQLSGFHQIGRDPKTGKYSANVANELYVGNPHKSNTMLIQQYVMRSVNDNYFTITRKSDNVVVYKSVMEDMLFGDQYGRYPLYKSHVDAGYLSAGYIAHRAYAAVPLYNPETNEAFADGEYELKFNYQLVGCNNEWVSKAYTLHIDSSEAEFDSITEFKTSEGVDKVRFNFKDQALSFGVLGYSNMEVGYDEEKGLYYIEETRENVLAAIKELGVSSSGANRLYLQATDKAYGEIGVIIHFSDLNDLTKYEAIAHRSLLVNNDYKYDDKGNLVVFSIDVKGKETIVELDGTPISINPAKGGANLGLILGLSIPGGVLLLAGIGVAIFFILRKRKQNAANGSAKEE